MAPAIDLELVSGYAGVMVLAERLLQAAQLDGRRCERFAVGFGEIFELVA